MVDRIILACTLVLAGVYFWATTQIPSLDLGDPLGPKAFPRMLGVLLLLGALMLFFEILRGRRNDKEPGVAGGSQSAAQWAAHHWMVLAVAGWTALYFVAFEPLGYVLATAAYLLALTEYFNRGRRLMNVLTSTLFALGSYLMFTKLLGVNLPPGILPF
jgi:putative tricarboxylic transport membrane protein